jgi:hypothetical protein
MAIHGSVVAPPPLSSAAACGRVDQPSHVGNELAIILGYAKGLKHRRLKLDGVCGIDEF